MKRICTEAEKELLYKNRDQMLEGIYHTASRSKLSHTLAAIFLAGITAIAVSALLIVAFHPSKIVAIVLFLFCFFLFNAVFAAILNTFRINKAKKAFMKQENLMINGATLVGVDAGNQFVYIEDDFLDEKGRPVLIEYPSRVLEISQEDEGKRFLVIYDSDSNFQLVRLNEELKDLVPSSSPHELTGDWSDHTRIPHPNMANVDREGHALSQGEKEKFADLYVKVVQSVSIRMIKHSLAALAVIAVILCFLLSIAEGGYPLAKTVPIAVGGWVGLVLLLAILLQIGKVNLRRQGRKLAHVKEVVFHSYVIEDNSTTVKVYEWVDGKAVLREYSAGNVAMDTRYGSIIYKFTNEKGKEVLLNRRPVGK